MEYVSAKVKAEEWGISLRRTQKLCEEGRVKGVERVGKVWLIPKRAQKPRDLRYATNKSQEGDKLYE